MDLDRFWNIIDLIASQSRGDQRKRERLLTNWLAAPEPEEIIDFQRIMVELYHRANHWDLWAAAYILHAGCSDDSFMDFRNWLISRGREAYEGVLCDPQSLPQWAEGEDCLYFEEFSALPHRAYKVRTGRDMLHDLEARSPAPHPVVHRDPAGERWDRDEELATRFPRLYPRHWDTR